MFGKYLIYRIKNIDTGFNDKYAYGVQTRTVALSRGNRQGNNALNEDVSPIYPGRNHPRNRGDFCLLYKIRRTKFVHHLVLTNSNFENWIKSRFHALVEAGNVDMAAFVAKLITKHGGYGFNDYHLLALVLDIDPKAELEKERIKEEKLKLENKNKIIEENVIPVKKRRGIDYEKLEEEKKKPILFGEPFLTKEEQIALLKKMRKANTTKKPYSNMGITPMHCACINPNPLALKHFIDVGDDLYVYDLELRKPVHYAACSRTPENLKVLQSKGVDLRDTDKVRKTPLMFACEFGRLENVKYILENTESNIDQKSRLSRGPIHFAAEQGHLGKLLIKS